MSERLPFRVQQIEGNDHTFGLYGERATEILTLAYREISDYGVKPINLIYCDFLLRNARIFLLFLEELLIGYTSYYWSAFSRMETQEMKALSLSKERWDEMQRQTVETGWTVIHPNFQHKGGWSMMMDARDDLLICSDFSFLCQYVRTANDYADKVAARYKGKVIFQRDTRGYGQQVYFRIRIP